MTLVASVALFLGCTASEAPNVAAPPAIVFDWLRNGNRDIYRAALDGRDVVRLTSDRKSTRLNSSHGYISYAVFCLKKKKNELLSHTNINTITQHGHSY